MWFLGIGSETCAHKLDESEVYGLPGFERSELTGFGSCYPGYIKPRQTKRNC